MATNKQGENKMASKRLYKKFKVHGETVAIHTRQATHMCHPNGWYVWVNGVRYHRPWLERDRCVDETFALWVKEYGRDGHPTP